MLARKLPLTHINIANNVKKLRVKFDWFFVVKHPLFLEKINKKRIPISSLIFKWESRKS